MARGKKYWFAKLKRFYDPVPQDWQDIHLEPGLPVLRQGGTRQDDQPRRAMLHCEIARAWRHALALGRADTSARQRTKFFNSSGKAIRAGLAKSAAAKAVMSAMVKASPALAPRRGVNLRLFR